ncbi:trimeric intracellular cation channel family protein, partial [Lysinibacillus xylanilyticus]|uniref:trimeric intracellular cation channel family protein n=1 Tax=Lysinibacillus xylanilyticus TaxID=582475 RepID=UPI003830CFEE
KEDTNTKVGRYKLCHSRDVYIFYEMYMFFVSGQDMMFQIAIAAITIFFIFPHRLIQHWHRWGNFTDAIGLSAFAIQGALYAVKLDMPISAVVVAAVLTGSGGGIIRDLLARRKPLVLRDEVYGVWAALAGLMIGLQQFSGDIFLYVLFGVITVLRILSYMKKWRLPLRKLNRA